MKIDFTYLRSRLARRIFWLFVVCALLPICMLAAVGLLSVSKELKQQNYRQLSQASHDEGMIIFERLILLEANLRVLTTDPNTFSKSNVEAALMNTEPHFKSLALLHGDGRTETLAGQEIGTYSLSPEERVFLKSGKTLLTTRECSVGQICTYLVRELGPKASQDKYAVGEVLPSFLWNKDDLSESMDLCILGPEDQILYGSRAVPKLNTEGSSGKFEWLQDGQIYPAYFWKLPMKAKFFQDHWTIVTTDERDPSLSTWGSFRRNFLLVILLAMWIVLFLSLIQIRRTLGPLEQLQEGTRKIAHGEREVRVEVVSNDEFQELGASFNLMSSRIESHMRSLATLNEIDRAILSSWELDKIVEALFSRLPNLLSYEVAGITVIGSNNWGNLKAYTAGFGGQLQFTHAMTSAHEMSRLVENPESFTVDFGDLYPQYLLSLVSQGMRHFLVLPIMVEGKPSAVLAFGHTNNKEWSTEDKLQARRVADQVAVAFSNAGLVNQLKQLRWGTLTALARAIDAKSSWTAGHSERVTTTAIKIGREMGLSEDEVDVLHAGGLLHDVGKIGVSLEVLDKPGPLTPDERMQIQEHVLIGVRILKPIPGFEKFLPIVREHHEWFNGKGYPYGISGHDISLHGRIFAVADVHDALISDRPYRKGMPTETAFQILRDGSGSQFDPRVVDAFFRMVQKEDTATSAVMNETLVLIGRE